MKKGKKDKDNPHFPTFFTFLPIIIVLFLAQRKYHGERLETQDNIVVARTCLEGNTHRLADVGNRGLAQRSPR